MKAFVITLKGHEFSEQQADRCVESGIEYGVVVEHFYGVDKANARDVMKTHGLEWSWANNNTTPSVCPITKLKQRPYYNANLEAKIGCEIGRAHV